MMLHPETSETLWNSMRQVMTINIEIQGVIYYSASDIMKEVGVSRQTFWRWRQDGKIPQGHRFRDGRILFTSAEVDLIRQFANRIEPPNQVALNQLSLFSQKS